jgi:hypothetical protein
MKDTEMSQLEQQSEEAISQGARNIIEIELSKFLESQMQKQVSKDAANILQQYMKDSESQLRSAHQTLAIALKDVEKLLNQIAAEYSPLAIVGLQVFSRLVFAYLTALISIKVDVVDKKQPSICVETKTGFVI